VRDNWRRRAKELHATGARATREKIFREDESQKCQTLGDELIFSLAKRLGTWQTPTNGEFQLLEIPIA